MFIGEFFRSSFKTQNCQISHFQSDVEEILKFCENDDTLFKELFDDIVTAKEDEVRKTLESRKSRF